MRRWPAILLCLTAALPCASAQVSGPPLDFKLGKVPEALIAHLPSLAKTGGFIIEDLAADSPSYRAGLRRHDILIAIEGKVPKNVGAWMQTLAQARQKKLQLTLVRQGKERTHIFALPADDLLTKSYLKPGGPPAVTVQAQPQKDGQINLIILYFTENSSKLERLSCQAPAADIERRFRAEATKNHVPENVQDLVEAALRRVRELNPPKQEQK